MSNYKYICRQVALEDTDSSGYFDFDDFSGIIFLMNRNYHGRNMNGLYEIVNETNVSNYIFDVENSLEEKPVLADFVCDTEQIEPIERKLNSLPQFSKAVEEWIEQRYFTESILIKDYFPKYSWNEKSRAYEESSDIKLTKEEVDNIREIVHKYDRCHVKSYEEEIAIPLLDIITGQSWTTRTLRGCCQSDWIDIIYPMIGSIYYTTDEIRYLEAMYFNTGTEWIVSEIPLDVDTTSEDFDVDAFDIGSYYIMAYDYKKGLSEQLNVNEDSIEIWEFDGYYKKPKWKKMS